MSGVLATPLEGLLVIESKVFADERGLFCEIFHSDRFQHAGLPTNWKQDNWSRSARGVLRGLHFQRAPHAQAKLVRVVHGAAFDVAVDIRPQSKTYGKWFGIELSASNAKALYIPEGFAHGFQALEDNTDLIYKCSNHYHPESDDGIAWNDLILAISWPLPKPLLSAKDLKLRAFEL